MTFEEFAAKVPAKVLAGLIDLEVRGVITHRTAVELLRIWTGANYVEL